MERRTFLATTVFALSTALGGCLLENRGTDPDAANNESEDETPSVNCDTATDDDEEAIGSVIGIVVPEDDPEAPILPLDDEQIADFPPIQCVVSNAIDSGHGQATHSMTESEFETFDEISDSLEYHRGAGDNPSGYYIEHEETVVAVHAEIWD